MKNKTTSKGTVIEATIAIHASAERVWGILKNPADIGLYHPLIKSSKMLSSIQEGIGAQRICDLAPMGQMIEVITDWEEGRSYTTKVIDGRLLPPYEFMEGKITVSPLDSNISEVTFAFHYKLKYGGLGKLMDVLLVRPQFKGAPKKYVAGLKTYVEGL